MWGWSMNQLINLESMSLEQLKEFEIQLTKKKIEILQSDVIKLANKADQHELAIKEVETKTDYLKENLTVDTKGANKVHRLGKLKVTEVLGGKDSVAYKELSRKVFSNFWCYYCYRMKTTSYRDTKAEQMNEAEEFIENWKPKKQLQEEIDLLNLIIE